MYQRVVWWTSKRKKSLRYMEKWGPQLFNFWFRGFFVLMRGLGYGFLQTGQTLILQRLRRPRTTPSLDQTSLQVLSCLNCSGLLHLHHVWIFKHHQAIRWHRWPVGWQGFRRSCSRCVNLPRNTHTHTHTNTHIYVIF